MGGLVLGLSLRPGAPPQPEQPWAQVPAASAAAPGFAPPSSAGAAVPNGGGLPKSPVYAEAPDSRPAARPVPVPAPAPAANDAETLRRNLAAEQARLDALARARTAAEAQLAQLQEQVAQREQAAQREILARREAALASCRA